MLQHRNDQGGECGFVAWRPASSLSRIALGGGQMPQWRVVPRSLPSLQPRRKISKLGLRWSSKHGLTIILAHRVSWKTVITLCDASDATQHHGRCPLAHCNIARSSSVSLVCSVVGEGRVTLAERLTGTDARLTA